MQLVHTVSVHMTVNVVRQVEIEIIVCFERLNVKLIHELLKRVNCRPYRRKTIQ